MGVSVSQLRRLGSLLVDLCSIATREITRHVRPGRDLSPEPCVWAPGTCLDFLSYLFPMPPVLPPDRPPRHRPCGLVPRQNSSGGKARLGRISKRGDQYLRWLLVAGAMSVVNNAKRSGKPSPWLAKMIANKPTKVAAVALANKNARVAWVLLKHGGTYQKAATIAAE